MFNLGDSNENQNFIDSASGNDYNIGRGDNNVNQDTEILGNRGISTVSGSGNGVRQQGKNATTLSQLLGRNKKNNADGSGLITAGESGFLDIYKGHSGVHDTKTGQDSRRFWESNVRNLQRIELKEIDSAGRTLNSDLQNKLSDTVFKNEDGTIISLYHWTDASFDRFEKGDIGFHFGTLDAAHSIQFDKSKDNGGYFKEVFLNIKNPVFLENDPVKWTALTTTEYLCRDGIFTDEDFKYIQNYDNESFNTEEYDSKSLNEVRNLLKEKGYDGIVYTNDWEGGLSAIALYPDQIVTVAENGVLKENSGISETDSEESVFSLPEGEDVPKPDSEIYELSKNILPSTENKVERKKLTLAEKQTLKKLGNALNKEIIFFDAERLRVEKGLKNAPEGYTDGNIIYISESVKNPLAVVFAHEFTDSVAMKYITKDADGNTVFTKEFENVINYAFESEAFLNFAKSKGYDTVPKLIWATVQSRQKAGDSNFVDKGSNELRTQASIELLSDFIGSTLTSDIKSLESFVNKMNAPQKKTFLTMLKDFVKRIKASIQSMIKGDRKAVFEYEVDQIERKLAKLYQNAPQTIEGQKENTADSGVRYSLGEYSNKQKENWANSKRIVLYESENQLKEFVKKSISGDIENKKMYFGTVTSELADRIYADTKIDVEGYNVSLSSYEIRKINNDHGNEQKENPRGQRAVKIDDYPNILNVILNPNSIELDILRYNGKPVINFKRNSNEKYTVCAIVSDKHLDLYIQTAYIGIKKGNLATPTTEQAVVNTPKASNSTVSNDSIHKNSETVNTNDMQNTENNSNIRYSIPTDQASLLDKYENGEITREEYLEQTDINWGRANEQYGIMESSENPTLNIAVPKAVEDNKYNIFIDIPI